MSTLNKAYLSHIFRYVGVGLISGSVVHAGTLGGAWLKYLILIIVGIIAFIVGTYLESNNHLAQNAKYILITIIISIGTGMISGATQHYLDGPFYAAVLLPAGLLVGYLAFAYRDYKNTLKTKNILTVILISVAIWLGLYAIAEVLPHSHDHGHSLLSTGQIT